MNPVCSCSLEIEDTSHYLLHCHHFTLHRIDLTNSVKFICNNFESMTNNNKITLLLYGDSRFDENKINLYCNRLKNMLGDSRNYTPLILVPSSAKRITTQILVIAKLNGKKRLSDCDWARTHNHLVHKRRLNHLTKLAK